MAAGITVRERAEAERSRSEARNTAHLRIPDRELRRYISPSLHTCYPLEYAFHVLGDVRGKRVVDFGCGSGENTVLLARRGAHVLGVDISEALIHLARRRLREHGIPDGVAFCAASAHQLPLAADSVDVIFGIAILHHLDVSLVRGEVWRVLKSGGRAIFQEPVRESRLLRRVRPLMPWRDPDVSPFEQPLTHREVGMLASGFSTCRVRAFVLPHVSIAERLRVNDAHLHRCYRLDGTLLSRMPALARFAAIRVIELTK